MWTYFLACENKKIVFEIFYATHVIIKNNYSMLNDIYRIISTQNRSYSLQTDSYLFLFLFFQISNYLFSPFVFYVSEISRKSFVSALLSKCLIILNVLIFYLFRCNQFNQFCFIIPCEPNIQ